MCIRVGYLINNLALVEMTYYTNGINRLCIIDIQLFLDRIKCILFIHIPGACTLPTAGQSFLAPHSISHKCPSPIQYYPVYVGRLLEKGRRKKEEGRRKAVTYMSTNVYV